MPVLIYAVPYLLAGIAGPSSLWSMRKREAVQRLVESATALPLHSIPRCCATGLIQLLHRDFQPITAQAKQEAPRSLLNSSAADRSSSPAH